MVGPEFEKYDPEIQQRFIQHFSLTQQTMAQQAAYQGAPGQPVRTTLSLKGTVGPTVAAEILNKSGVPQATPEQFTEQMNGDLAKYGQVVKAAGIKAE